MYTFCARSIIALCVLFTNNYILRLINTVIISKISLEFGLEWLIYVTFAINTATKLKTQCIIYYYFISLSIV